MRAIPPRQIPRYADRDVIVDIMKEAGEIMATRYSCTCHAMMRERARMSWQLMAECCARVVTVCEMAEFYWRLRICGAADFEVGRQRRQYLR